MSQQANLRVAATIKLVERGVLDSVRLRARMAEKNLSQSELARRVGISQASIYNLVSGGGYGSKHLHVIARELGTTPAYLTGETNDPDEDAPAAKPLDSEARELIDKFAGMTPADRRAVLQIVRSMDAGGGAADTLHAPSGRAYRGEDKGR